MKYLILILALIIPTMANATLKENNCQQQLPKYFNDFMKTCVELRLEYEDQLANNKCQFIYSPFVPTKKIPFMKSYRMVFIQYRTADCVAIPW